MNKKKPHKKHKKLVISRKPTLVFSLLVLAGFFVLFFGSVQLFHLTNTVHVLGVQSVLPANTEVEHEEVSENEEERIKEKQREYELEEEALRLKKAKLERIRKELEVGEDTLVDCIGPDAKHFTTTYASCYELNRKWKNEDFSFTPLTKSTNTTEKKQKRVEKEPTDEIRVKEKEAAESAMEEKKKLIEKQRQEEAERVEKKRLLQEKLMKEDGEVNSQTELQEELKAWEKEENKVVLETSENHSRLIKHKKTKAESLFPVSVNEETNELTITTPSGTKTVTVLPDKAVENILKAHVLTNVETELSSESGDLAQKLLLTELNNEVVFAIRGVKEKKVLGVIPVAFSKTVYVSAEDGDVVKTDQSLLNSVLENISF